eukprot:scaffold90053_cov58-Phaeocystis_antarctica.AAC.3
MRAAPHCVAQKLGRRSLHQLGDQSGQAPVTDQVVAQVECLQLGQLAQGWRQCHHTHIPDLVIVERGQTAAAEARRQQGHALVAAIVTIDVESLEHRQRATTDKGAERPPVGEGEGLVVAAA